MVPVTRVVQSLFARPAKARARCNERADVCASRRSVLTVAVLAGADHPARSAKGKARCQKPRLSKCEFPRASTPGHEFGFPARAKEADSARRQAICTSLRMSDRTSILRAKATIFM